MTQDNKATPSDVEKGLDKLTDEIANFVRTFTAERTKNADLAKENGDLKAKVSDAEKALNDEKAARKAHDDGILARIGRISAIIGGATVVVLFLAIAGYISFPAGNRQQVADTGQLEKIEQTVSDARKDAAEARSVAESMREGQQKLATALHKLATAGAAAPAATPAVVTKKQLPGNWALLKADDQLYHLIETCTPVDAGWQNFDEKGYKTLLRILKILKLDQAQAEQFVQTSCKVVDFKVVGFRTALNTDSHADEDAAAAVMRGERPEATNTQYAAPPPWIQPGPRQGYVGPANYGQPPVMGGRPGLGSKGRALCESGVMTPKGCKHTITDRAALVRVSPPKATDPNCNGNQGYWTTAQGPYGMMRVHRTCVY